MKKLTSYIPNTLTCMNLAAGCAAIVFAFQGEFVTVFWLITAACVFDFFDGFAARMLKAHSVIGADLDSLADMVSFGVLPSVVLFQMLKLSETAGSITLPISFLAFFVAIFSALRLAKFNNDTRQSEEFRGLATPASTLLVVSLGTQVSVDGSMYTTLVPYFLNPAFLVCLIIFLCAIMVSDLPMFSFKFKKFGLRDNAVRYVFVLFSLSAVVLFRYLAPAIIILAYILVSLGLWFSKNNHKTDKVSDNEL